MNISNREDSKTLSKYTITADNDELEKFKNLAAKHLADKVSVPGFRKSKAPVDMILKHADPEKVQEEFINHAVNDLYIESQRLLDLKTIGDPKITISKFVPFTTLEIDVQVPVISEIKLADYKHLKIAKDKTEVPKEEIDKNLHELRKRSAIYKPVNRAAKLGDQVTIDFEGQDFKTKENLPQATATDYTLILGENTLIPGFEDNLVGLKDGENKDFTLTFPKEYPEASFASRKVTFKATLKTVNEVDLPKLDDEFAATVGPFKTLTELKTELKKQLNAEMERQATVELENKILNEIAEKTVIELDDQVIDQEAEAMSANAKQSAINRGQTWQEYLASRGQSEDEYQKELHDAAVIRVKGGIAIGEIANKENISINDQDIDAHIAALKAQYFDPQMQAELDDPKNRRELAMRILTEKVLDVVQSYNK